MFFNIFQLQYLFVARSNQVPHSRCNLLTHHPFHRKHGQKMAIELSTMGWSNHLVTEIYPPTPADARGSALGNNTFDPGFGLVPLLYSIGQNSTQSVASSQRQQQPVGSSRQPAASGSKAAAVAAAGLELQQQHQHTSRVRVGVGSRVACCRQLLLVYNSRQKVAVAASSSSQQQQ